MPNSSTTRATTTRATTTRADTDDPAASTSSVADISAAATDGATSATATSKAHAVERAGSAGTGHHRTGHTTTPGPRSMTANEPSAPGHLSSPDQAAPAMNESAHDKVADDRDRAGADTIGDAVPDRVWTALLAHPASTPAELAAAADAGRSTVSKLLAGWAGAGRVTSAAGGTARAARRWTAVPVPASVAPAAATPAPEPPTGCDTSQRAPRSRSGVATAGRAGDTQAAADGPTAHQAAAGRDRRTPGAETGDALAPAAPARTGTRSPRLGAGQLRGLVEEFLAEHPGTHGPVEIGHVLRRSGAIANLCGSSEADEVSDPPSRAAEDAPEPDSAGLPASDTGSDGREGVEVAQRVTRTAGAGAPVVGAAPVGGRGSRRLAAGALRGMVEDFLAERPGQDFGPTAIGHALRRSSGAVANALERLRSDGVVALTGERPRRYSIATAPE
jgi:hypothetical protein